MFISVKHIERGGLRVERLVKPHTVTDADGRVIPFEPAALEGMVEPRQEGFRFRGRVSAVGTFECSRCLEPYRHALEADFDLFYSAAPPEGAGLEDSEAKLDAASLAPLQDERIDLTALVSEQINLNLPLKPLCKPGCLGLCAGCGTNRNLGPCGCEHEAGGSSPDRPLTAGSRSGGH